MYRIISERGTGKTTNLITLAKETGATIVSYNPIYVIEKMYRLGITGVDIVSYEEFQEKQIGMKKPYLIDDLEEFVKTISGSRNMLGYTLTKIKE